MSLTPAQRQLIVSELPIDARVRLREVPGRIVTPREFATTHLETLTQFERQFVHDRLAILSSAYPNALARPLAIGEKTSTEGVVAVRSGSRSALLPERELYLKGCRPRFDRPDLFFPFIDCDFVTGAVTESQVPFGVMTVNGVMKELLGFLAYGANGWEYARTPVAVFEYAGPGDSMAYCLAFSLPPAFKRIETLLRWDGPTLDDLLAIESVREVTGLDLAPGELLPDETLAAGYAQIKGNLLAEMHVAGCFRGFLNSNPGNDMLVAHSKPLRLALVDFDSFVLLDLAQLSSDESKRRIIELACLEAAKSLLPILDFVVTPLNDRRSAFSAVFAVVESKCSIWQAYRDSLRNRLVNAGWSSAIVNAGFAKATESTLFQDSILDLVPNSYVLATSYPSTLTLYGEQLH